MKLHRYETRLTWTGNLGTGTSAYTAYSRDYDLASDGRPVISASSDPAFRGDPSRYNPEQLLVSSLSSCHMLWYLHLCAVAKVIVVAYEDHAEGVMAEQPGGSGAFTQVTLRPLVTVTSESDAAKALALHEEAHRHCFIANSVNFPVTTDARVKSH